MGLRGFVATNVQINAQPHPLTFLRSVRMGYGEEDEDYVCANICPVAANNSFTESKLYAVFSGMESEVSGQITMVRT